ncbi:hypothetical protein AbraIFM66951_011233 [Aspergillus brasiliensis]|uniref:Uncharacterized protein n=1 Tax=Aspergillus brasiliensis TaxID=319629 RepID=A0A9W6DS69_9EURO|nr:hypothetical protein AbraCBS73388_001161 [Aspergillus brasiliensis]GKZ47674.1 hypothetical protein AbraIFM66951_011233 [Aspergillus brasiliensis]
MSTPSEQKLLYGRTLDPEQDWLEIRAVLDLTPRPVLVFGFFVISSFVALYHKMIISCGLLGCKLLAAVLSPVKSFVACSDALKRWMITSQMSRRLSALGEWYLPANRPIATIVRCFTTLVMVVWSCQDILLPSYHFLYGVAGGMGPAGGNHSEYCDYLDRGSPAGRWSSSRRLQGFHCQGIYTGAELNLEDYVPKLSGGDGNLPHLRILSFASVFIILASMVALIAIALPQSSIIKCTKMLRSARLVLKNGAEDKPHPQDLALLQQVELLSVKVGTYEAMLDEVRGQLAAKTDEANGLQARHDRLWSTAKMLGARCEEAKVAQKEHLMQATKLRQELAQVNYKLMTAQEELCGVQNNSYSRDQTVANRVAELEEQLALKSDEADANSRGQVESLKADLQVKTQELNAIARRLVTAEAQAGKTCDSEQLRVAEERLAEKDAQIEELKQRLHAQEQHTREELKQRLQAQEQQSYEELKERLQAQEQQSVQKLTTAAGKLTDRDVVIQKLQEQVQFYETQCQMQAAQLGAAEQEVFGLQAEREELERRYREKEGEIGCVEKQYEALFDEHMKLTGQYASLKSLVEQNPEAQEALDLRVEVAAIEALCDEKVREAEEEMVAAKIGHREAMEGLRKAYDGWIEQERAAANEAQRRLREEIKEMSQQVGIALRDAQRFQKQKEGIEAESESSQAIPKRRTGDLGSLATALDQSRVTVSQQQTEINGLRALLHQAQTASVPSAPSAPLDQALRDSVNRLRQALEAEKRQRTEDQIRWTRQVRELEEEARRLRVSSSNSAQALARRRPG